MGRDLYKLTKIFDDIIVMLILAEYLKNGSTDFHQTYVIFRQLYIKVFEIKRLKTDHSLLPWQPIHEGVLD